MNQFSSDFPPSLRVPCIHTHTQISIGKTDSSSFLFLEQQTNVTVYINKLEQNSSVQPHSNSILLLCFILTMCSNMHTTWPFRAQFLSLKIFETYVCILSFSQFLITFTLTSLNTLSVFFFLKLYLCLLIIYTVTIIASFNFYDASAQSCFICILILNYFQNKGSPRQLSEVSLPILSGLPLSAF